MAWRGKQNTFMYARARERQRETTHILFEHPTTFSPAATTRRRCCLVVVSASYKLHQHTNTNTPTYLHTSTPSHTLSTPSAHPLTHPLLLHTPSAMFKPPWVPEELSGRQPQSPAPRTHVQTQLDRMRNADPSVKSAGIPNVDPDQGQYCACHAPAESARGERRAKRSVPALTFC